MFEPAVKVTSNSSVNCAGRDLSQIEKTASQLFLSMGTVRVAVSLMVITAIFVLIGAWCPQESAVGQEKIIEQFGTTIAPILIQIGLTDLFHTPLFLFVIALLSVSITVASFKKVFPRLRVFKQALPLLTEVEINRLPIHEALLVNEYPSQALDVVAKHLKKSGFFVRVSSEMLVAESGKIGRASASVTHVGLITLLIGVTTSSWTGFSGFQPVRLGQKMSFAASEHSKLWLGKLPGWQVKVEKTRREDYPTGEAKQWYSTLSVVDPDGRTLSRQEISVNNPLSYDGVDIYQSTWGMDQVVLSFNGRERAMDLRPMGKRYAAFLPLDETTILIFSIKEQDKPLRLFAKRPDWPGPRLLSEIAPGASVQLGGVEVKYIKPVPVTGLQYKRDPGLPITYAAFVFIMLGVTLASIPHRKIWASARRIEHSDGSSTIVSVGGISHKAKVGFEKVFGKLVTSFAKDFKNGLRAESIRVHPKMARLAKLAETGTNRNGDLKTESSGLPASEQLMEQLNV